eukprot:gene3233-2153_t
MGIPNLRNLYESIPAEYAHSPMHLTSGFPAISSTCCDQCWRFPEWGWFKKKGFKELYNFVRSD